MEEKQRRLKSDILSFARRYFSCHEVEFLHTLSDPDIQRQEFIKLWTLKVTDLYIYLVFLYLLLFFCRNLCLLRNYLRVLLCFIVCCMCQLPLGTSLCTRVNISEHRKNPLVFFTVVYFFPFWRNSQNQEKLPLLPNCKKQRKSNFISFGYSEWGLEETTGI